ncbi:unnamed protein product [Polarella glacialis]|uniref:Ubiquitin-like domain-containing protein n=1 Tax=Polarella glacialis TaxID=89957 RepID=A0A813G6X5_POLGL|nr:unnamed protein product [Polarella glacialis]
MALFGNRKKKKHDSRSVPNLPNVDFVLSFLTLGMFVGDMLLLARMGSNVLVELITMMLCTAVCITCCKLGFPHIGRALSTSDALKKPRNLRKFSDQSWQLMVHAGMTWYEIGIFRENGWEWWTDTRTLWRPLQHESESSLADLRRLYLAQLGVWFITAFSHKFVEAKHNDYFVMYGHHVATIGLVSLSLFNGWDRLGLVIMFLHDSSDIVVDILKMTNYLGLDSESGLFLAEACFAINLVTWPILRMWYFPMKAMRSSLPLSWGWGDYPYELESLMSFANACRGLLVVLLVMHCWWYFLFLRILARLIKGNAGHDAGREYEGSSDSMAEEGAANVASIQQIAAEYGVPGCEQRLIFGGQSLEASELLGACRVTKVELAVLKFYKVDSNDKMARLRCECPHEVCGPGVFMAMHFNRCCCGTCHLTYLIKEHEK